MSLKYLFFIPLTLIFVGCFALEENPKNCDDLEEGLFGGRDTCWTNTAVSNSDLQYCDNIKGSQKSTCYGRVAIGLIDMSICNTNKIDKGICTRVYLEERLEDELNTCTAMTDKQGSSSQFGSLRTQCYVFMATMSGEISVCRHVDNQDLCYGHVAAQSSTDILCEDSPNPSKCKDIRKDLLED